MVCYGISGVVNYAIFFFSENDVFSAMFDVRRFKPVKPVL